MRRFQEVLHHPLKLWILTGVTAHVRTLGYSAVSRTWDSSIETTYAAVGRSLSEWERLELDLARLYAKFIGLPPIEAIARPEYTKAKIFRARADTIDEAGKTYFVTRPNQAVEGDFERVICDARKLSDRRNDIAHGIVQIFWQEGDRMDSETMEIAIRRGEYMLTPATYKADKFGPARKPAYLLSSAEINRFADHFREFRSRIESVLAALG